MSERSILAVQYTPVTPRLGRRVGGFLDYIRERDVHLKGRGVEGLISYVANRDRSAFRGLLFGPEGQAGELDCRRLTAYVGRSVRDWKPQLIRDASGATVDARRAVSRFVISPERAEGLDLQQLTRSILSQLERDAGGLPPWIAAEHRNTEHRHVHLVLASRRQIAPGRYRTVKITRERLQRMKQAMLQEIERQREQERLRSPQPQRSRELGWIAELEREAGPPTPQERAAARRARTLHQREPAPRPGTRQPVPTNAQRASEMRRTTTRLPTFRPSGRRQLLTLSPFSPTAARLHRLAERYRRQAEREAESQQREREREQEREQELAR